MATMTTLDSFTRAYIDCALWSSDDGAGESLDRRYTIDDLDAATLTEMIADCAAFQRDNASLLDCRDAGRGGCDFWLTRNRHGAGFWDGDWPEAIGRRLTDAAHVYGEYNLTAGDDGVIYGG